MAEWINVLSLKVSLFAALLAVVSYQMGGGRAPIFVIAALFCITSTTMLQNSWRDRQHDVRKGKMLVSQNEAKFKVLLFAAWLVSTVLTTAVLIQDIATGTLLVAMMIVALTYSETRRVPMLPITLVALTSASPVLLPVVSGIRSDNQWFLFVATAFIIFSREITRDLEDWRIDPGYKWTLPVVAGKLASTSLALIAAFIGLFFSAAASWWAVPGAIVAVWGTFLFHISRKKTVKARTLIDIGMVITLLTLLIVQMLELPLHAGVFYYKPFSNSAEYQNRFFNIGEAKQVETSIAQGDGPSIANFQQKLLSSGAREQKLAFDSERATTI